MARMASYEITLNRSKLARRKLGSWVTPAEREV